MNYQNSGKTKIENLRNSGNSGSVIPAGPGPRVRAAGLTMRGMRKTKRSISVPYLRPTAPPLGDAELVKCLSNI